jgi:hypothetical protein
MKTPRILMLSLLIPVLAAASNLAVAPVAMAEACARYEHTWEYFSDAAKTQLVGERYRNDCDGSSYTWGQTTAYFNYWKVCCDS